MTEPHVSERCFAIHDKEIISHVEICVNPGEHVRVKRLRAEALSRLAHLTQTRYAREKEAV
jgi:hypothetical protein